MAFTHKKTGSVIRAAGPFYFTPKMTDAAAPVPYVASASSYDSFLAFESFSGTTHEGWAGKGSWSGGYGNDWLKLDLGYMVAYPLSGYVVDKTNIFGKNRGGKAWTVWGSPDDTEESVWTLLDTVTGQTGWDTTDPVRQFDCDAGLSSKFRYLKWVFTENDGGDRIMPGQISLFYMPTDSLISYPMPVWVGESTEINIAFLQDWDSQPYATKNQTTVNSADGILDVTSTGTDPYISMYTLGSFDPNIYNGIRIRYKVVSGTAGNVQIYFTNARRTSANADQVVAVALISDGEWHICDIDMSAHRYWTNSNITGWRYDWCSANTVNMQIDYIALGTCRIGDVNCEGKCKSDFGDVRFYDGAGSKLDYMIDWKTLAGETPYQKVKMLVATNPEPDSMPVIIQYGDSGAMSESNPALVLYEYKNFESGVCDASISVSDADWVVDSGAVTIDATFLPHYPTEYSAATAKATTNFSSYYPYLAFNPSLSTVGGYSGVEWLTSTKTNQRLHVDCGEAFVCQFIEYVNGHASGGSTNIGCKDFTFWGSNSTDAFADTAYDHDDGWTQIDGSMQFAQHINSNVIDIHTIRLISNSASYRYYAFKIANNWGSTSYLSMRHIELKSMVTGGNQRAMLAGGATAAEAHIALTASNLQALQCRVEKNLLSAVYPILHGDGTKRVAIYCDTSNNINYLNSGGNVIDTGADCKHKAVVEIEVRNLQFEFGLYDIWVDGICVRYGAEMQTSADNEDEWAMLNAINNGYDAWVDDAAVRQYSNPEPTWGAWGAEEVDFTPDTDFIVTTSLDGLLQDTLSATASLDAVLQGSPSSTVSLDSLLEDTNISSVSLDSMLVSTGSASAGLDAALVSAAPENWELTVETTDVDQTFTVNISVTATNIDITIDWDDGNAPVNYNTTGVKTCTYATAGTYYPKISGSFTNGGIKLGSRLKATGVIGGVTGFLSCGAMFESCTGLTTVPADLFRYVTGLGANAFNSTFKGCSGLASVPEDLFKYSTGAANNAFQSTFNGCSALTAVPEGLFRYNTAVGIEGFKDTFRDCSSLTTVPEDLFRYNTAVTSSAFRSTFYGCTGLTSIPAGLFQYNLNVSTHGFYQVFKGCTSLTTLPALLFRNNLWVTTSGFAGAFQDCTSLTTIPELFFRYNERVSTSGFSQTFSGCTSLASLPVDLFRYNKLVSTSGFHRTFYGCNKLTLNSRIFYAGDGLITRFASPVPTQNFTECFKLAGAFTGVQGTAPAMWDYTFNGTPTSIDCFDGHSAESVTNYYDIPKVWGGPEAVTETTSLDGLLQKSFTATTSLDGLLQDTVSTTTSLDAYLPDTATSTVSLDSLLQESSSATTSLDSLLEDIVSVTASLDSLLEDTVSATASLDSLLRDTNSAITGLDGQLQSSSSASISIDGMLSSSNQATTGLDAVLSDSATVVILSLDSLLQDTNSATTSLDSTLASISSASASLDAALQDTNTATVSLDAALLESVTATVGLDAVVITAIMSETVSLDALLEGTETSTASLDAILKMYYIESVETEIDLESETIAGIIYQQSIAESFYLWTTSQPSWSISVTSTTDLASTLTFDLGIDVYSYVTFTETLSSKWTGQLSILEAIALTSTAEDVRYLLEAITSTYDLSGAQVVTFELALTEWLDIKSAASNSSKMFFELLSTAGLSCSTVGIWLEEITSALNISSLTQYDIVEALESATDLSDTTLIYLAAALSDSIDLSSESRVALALSVLSEIGFTSLASFIGAPQESILSELEIADTLEDNGIFNHSLASSVFLTEEAQAALSLLVTSVLALTSTAALKKWLTEQVTSAAILASNTSALQSMYPSLESSLTITETLLGNGAFYETVQSALQLSVSIELDGDVYECWVLNSPKFLPSIYTDYDFNSYCTYENRAFAANATGVYELAGNADDVQASVVLSETDFEVSGHKRFRKAYLGISGTSPVLIMETDGQRKVYSIASDGKVNASRELLGKYWKLSVVDFDSIEYISLIPVVLSRGK